MAFLLRTRYRALSVLHICRSSPARFSYSKITHSTEQKVAPQYAYIEDAEKLHYYSPGGLHPVTIGDQPRSRYSIVLKLGFGTFSTTWLARDIQRGAYVAVKIARADSHSYELDNLCKLNEAQTSSTGNYGHTDTGARDTARLVPPLLDTFTVEGPNGKHPCFVTEAAARSLSDSKGGAQGGVFRLEVARVLAAQVACAVELVHSCGLVHGDLHLGNILLRLPHRLNDLSSEELYRTYGAPEYDAVSRTDGMPLSPGVPTQIPQPVWLGTSCEDIKLADARIFLADFGASFSPSDKSRAFSYAPTVVRPPEARFESTTATYSSDIWTLGCSIWNMLAWRSPFDNFFGAHDETTFQQADALGPLPASWWKKWTSREEYFTDQGTPKKGRSARPLEQRFEDSVQRTRREDGWPVVSLEEKTAFLTMIRSMLSYRPEDRPTIQEVLESEWMQKWALPEYENLRGGQVAS